MRSDPMKLGIGLRQAPSKLGIRLRQAGHIAWYPFAPINTNTIHKTIHSASRIRHFKHLRLKQPFSSGHKTKNLIGRSKGCFSVRKYKGCRL